MCDILYCMPMFFILLLACFYYTWNVSSNWQHGSFFNYFCVHCYKNRVNIHINWGVPTISCVISCVQVKIFLEKLQLRSIWANPQASPIGREWFCCVIVLEWIVILIVYIRCYVFSSVQGNSYSEIWRHKGPIFNPEMTWEKEPVIYLEIIETTSMEYDSTASVA